MKRILVSALYALMILSAFTSVTYANGNKVDRVSGENEEISLVKEGENEKDLDTLNLTCNKLSSLVLPIVQSYEVAEKAQNWKMDETTRFVIPNTEEYLNNSRLKEIVELVLAEFLAKQIPTAKEI